MATVRAYPGRTSEARAKAERLAAKTGRPVSLLQPFTIYSKKGKARKGWTTYDTVYPKQTNSGYRRRISNRSEGGSSSMKNILGIAAIGIGGYFLYQWWLAQQQGAVSVTSAVPNTTSPNLATVPTSNTSQTVQSNTAAPAPLPSLPVKVEVYNLTTDPTGNTPSRSFNVGDIVEVIVTGPPNTPVTYSGSQNGVAFAPVAIGSTDGGGIFNFQAPVPAVLAGTVIETWKVGGVIAGTVTLQVRSSGVSGLGLGYVHPHHNPNQPIAGNIAHFQNAPYGSTIPGRPFRESYVNTVITPVIPLSGMGRVYLNGFGGMGMGIIGKGYGINETFEGDASAYELASKYIM